MLHPKPQPESHRQRGDGGAPKLRHRCWLFSSGAMPTEVTSFSLEVGAHSKGLHIVTCSILRLWS